MEMKKARNIEIIRQLSLLFLLLLEIILFSLLAERFFSFSNAISILRQVSVTGISAMGMFMIILLGDIDLSVGSMYAFIGVVSALIFKTTESAVLAIIAALVIGTGIGFINGTITARFKIPAFITTLATMSVCSGFAYIITKGTPIGVTNPAFTFLGSGYIAGVIPLPIIFMLIVLALGYFTMYKTRFGRHIYACGGNAQAAKWSGINADKIKVLVFVIAGFLNGFAAIVLAIAFPRVLDLIVASYAYSASGLLVPIYCGYAFRKKNILTPISGIAGMVGGVVGCGLAQAFESSLPPIFGIQMPYAIYGIAASLVCLLVASAVTKKSK